MNIFTAILASLFITASFHSSSKDIPDNWVPILKMKYQDIEVFYDASSLISSMDGKVKINVGSILISSSTLSKIHVNGESFLARSQVKVIAIECKSGLSTTLYDFFFIQSKPLDNSKPVVVFEYLIDDASSAVTLPKSSPVSSILCSSKT
jgi:hypothetical protein